MKKIIILTSIIIVALFAANINNLKGTKEEYKIINTYVTDSNNTVVDFNDGSSVVINHEQNIYEFYQPSTGDWELKVNTHDDLIKVLKTYLINNYNIEPTEVDDHIIFNDLNLSI